MPQELIANFVRKAGNRFKDQAVDKAIQDRNRNPTRRGKNLYFGLQLMAGMLKDFSDVAMSLFVALTAGLAVTVTFPLGLLTSVCMWFWFTWWSSEVPGSAITKYSLIISGFFIEMIPVLKMLPTFTIFVLFVIYLNNKGPIGELLDTA